MNGIGGMPMAASKKQKEILHILEENYSDTVSALHFDNVFQLLVAVVLSAQTNDNQVNKITKPLFQKYGDAASLAALTAEELEPYIKTCGLYKNKAKNIVALSQKILSEYQGQVPQNRESLMSLPGVGRKTANVVLAVGFGEPALAVDTHVFRVSRRLGLASANTADGVEKELCAIIPKEKWASAHHWLIWHGRRLCHAKRPQCDICPLMVVCPQEKGLLKNA